MYYSLRELPPVSVGSVRMADAAGASPFVPGDWFQLAKVGTFFSPVYGKITISPKDLGTMYTNFKTKTPLPPTQLPIDYDHLSDEPQKPEDGKAAGWVQDLQIRDGGQTLWCQPLWTVRAAQMIASGEYRFVSPFFLTDYLDKVSGQKIGPTLKAVAVTNRPFLEGMQPIPAPAMAAMEFAFAEEGKSVGFAYALSDPRPRRRVVARVRQVAMGLSDAPSRCRRCGAPVAVVDRGDCGRHE